MRTLAITQSLTLDGAVEMLDDWFDPQAQGDLDDLVEESRRQDAAADAFLCGRQTFLDLRGRWRDLAEDRTGISDYLGGVQKYVVSSTPADPEWDRTTVLDGDPVVQGAGHRLLPDGFRARPERVAVVPFRSGVTLTTYAVR